MSEEAQAEEAFLKSLSENWVAGYPPWYWRHVVEQARCKNEEEGKRLLFLLRSIEDKKPDDTRKLLASGINPNLHLSRDEGRLIDFAASHYAPGCVLALLEAGATLKGTHALFRIIQYGLNDVLPAVLKAGPDLNERSYGETLLTTAINVGNTEAVRQLVDAGADVNAVAEIAITWKNIVKQCTPLMVAAFQGNPKMMKLLLTAGADPQRLDARGSNALSWAQSHRSQAKKGKMIALLQGAGMSLDDPASQPLPVGPDFSSRGKSANFKKAIALAREIIGSEPQKVTLEEGVLAGARAFLFEGAGRPLLRRVNDAINGLGTMAFLSNDVTRKNGASIVLLPTTDYTEAVITFETPVGQSLSSEDLVRWLKKLEGQQPFEIVELAPDLLRADFTSDITDPATLAKSIERICPDVINEPLEKVAQSLVRSRELYLWWD